MNGRTERGRSKKAVGGARGVRRETDGLTHDDCGKTRREEADDDERARSNERDGDDEHDATTTTTKTSTNRTQPTQSTPAHSKPIGTTKVKGVARDGRTSCNSRRTHERNTDRHGRGERRRRIPDNERLRGAERTSDE